jgi:hypothetical protein
VLESFVCLHARYIGRSAHLKYSRKSEGGATRSEKRSERIGQRATVEVGYRHDDFGNPGESSWVLAYEWKRTFGLKSSRRRCLSWLRFKRSDQGASGVPPSPETGRSDLYQFAILLSQTVGLSDDFLRRRPLVGLRGPRTMRALRMDAFIVKSVDSR